MAPSLRPRGQAQLDTLQETLQRHNEMMAKQGGCPMTQMMDSMSDAS